MKIQANNFLYGVATFNADPYCIENEDMCNELYAETEGELEEVVDGDDFEDATSKLDLEGHNPKHIYRCGSALVCLQEDFD